MTDIVSKKTRSRMMSGIRGKGNKSTEILLAKFFRKNGIGGWRRHQPITGKPDFVFLNRKVAVFVDGCFWHGCPRCYKKPSTNRKFWAEKLASNIKRDRMVNLILRREGWTVVRIWECLLGDEKKTGRKLGKCLS
jgi:DNA mismatch endonuclease (patch repair protein)